VVLAETEAETNEQAVSFKLCPPMHPAQPTHEWDQPLSFFYKHLFFLPESFVGVSLKGGGDTLI